MSFLTDILYPSLQGIVADILGILPRLLGALTILVIGWIAASMLRKLVSRLLDKIGFNQLVEKAGIAGFLQKSGFLKPPSWIIGQLIYWMILLTFVLSAAESLELHALVAMLHDFVAFIPKLITVAFILVLGAVLSSFVGKLVQGAAAESGMEFAAVLGKLVSNIILIAVVVISISQLEIESTILNLIFGILLGAFGLAVALTVGLGSRKISENIIAGFYARKMFKTGEELSLRGVAGTIVEIGTAKTVLRSGDELYTLPNAQLITSRTSRPGNA